jgi:hydroxyethylthiazole kinase-like uncharacterized protein yjeF
MKSIDRDWLATHPLPWPEPDSDKDGRGLILIAGGSVQTPGAVILAARSALRAGAGKLRVATVPEAAMAVAVQLPESRCLGLLCAADLDRLEQRACECAAVVLGPGMLDQELAAAALKRLLKVPGVLVVDALPLMSVPLEVLRQRAGPTVLTPNGSEMRTLLGRTPQEPAQPLEWAREAVERSGAVVVLKGRQTVILATGGRALKNRRGNVGLATSGSGDVLAGLLGGLAARGSDPFEAAAWAVNLHARAAERLAQKVGPLGFLAGELPRQIPPLMRDLAQPG